MAERDAEFWAIAENENLYGERVIQASFDERAVGIARFILYGEGPYGSSDFFSTVKDLGADYEIGFDDAVEALEISEARVLQGMVYGEA